MSALRLQELEEEVSYLRRQLGIEQDIDRVGRLGAALGLTRYEAQVLMILYHRTGSIVSKDTVMNAMYSGEDEPFIKIVDVYICKVRSRLGKDTILTIWGRGYQLSSVGQDMCRRALSGELTLTRPTRRRRARA